MKKTYRSRVLVTQLLENSMEIIVKIEKTMTMTNTCTKAKTVKFLYDSGSSSPGAVYSSGIRPGEEGWEAQWPQVSQTHRVLNP